MWPKKAAVTDTRYYKTVNNATAPDRCPIRYTHHSSGNLWGHMLFSKLDLIRAYYRIRITSGDIPKAAITIPLGFLLILSHPFLPGTGYPRFSETPEQNALWSHFCLRVHWYPYCQFRRTQTLRAQRRFTGASTSVAFPPISLNGSLVLHLSNSLVIRWRWTVFDQYTTEWAAFRTSWNHSLLGVSIASWVSLTSFADSCLVVQRSWIQSLTF